MPEAIYRKTIIVRPEALDENGHVNNVVWVQWMQDAAIEHSDTCGGTAAMREAAASWVARSHLVEYLAPAFEGDRIEVETWVADFRRVRSTRRYRFVHGKTGSLLVRGETVWVFVDRETGRPKTVPGSVVERFVVVD